MLPLLREISNNLDHYIINNSKPNEEIDLKVLMGKFSMDAIASCAFGVDSGSFKDQTSESEFVRIAKKNFRIIIEPNIERPKSFSWFHSSIDKAAYIEMWIKKFCDVASCERIFVFSIRC